MKIRKINVASLSHGESICTNEPYYGTERCKHIKVQSYIMFNSTLHPVCALAFCKLGYAVQLVDPFPFKVGFYANSLILCRIP